MTSKDPCSCNLCSSKTPYRTSDTTDHIRRLEDLEPWKPETKWLVSTIVSVILAGVAFDQGHFPIGGAFVCVAGICVTLSIAVYMERLAKDE